VHEALYATAPIGSCAYLNAPPPTDPFMGLGQLLAGESADIYPILGNFPGKSQVQAAVSLHPTLTTVWLGGNDLLKVLFSGGAYPAVSAQSMQADLTLIVQTLQNAGSQVALANIPNVLNTAALIAPQNVATVVGRFLVGAGVPAAVAAQYAGPFTQLVLATNNVGSGEYVTATGAGKIAAALGASLQTQTQAVPPVFVTGDTISPALAAQVQALNDSYNTTIQNVAQSTGAAFVDIRALFTASAAGVPINPPTCCDGLFGGGLFSYDGIHPSNTGYALVANAFIASIDAKFGTTIAPVSVTAAYATDPYAPH
jgi:lysophospholipase L1-like esterase